jgi:hypothetical protein
LRRDEVATIESFTVTWPNTTNINAAPTAITAQPSTYASANSNGA